MATATKTQRRDATTTRAPMQVEQVHAVAGQRIGFRGLGGDLVAQQMDDG
ncbi:hypothetical protein [Kibdelosporangium aridum]|nr:hypothetical protein [Kibdelosporangium aridum]